jgi:hypothetical protein
MAGLPVIKGYTTAKLPATYTSAREALDECATWAAKAEALASYARQAEDDALRRMAGRIQARAIRRMGELLQEIKRTAGRPARKWGGRSPYFQNAGRARRGDLPGSETDGAAGGQGARGDL